MGDAPLINCVAPSRVSPAATEQWQLLQLAAATLRPASPRRMQPAQRLAVNQRLSSGVRKRTAWPAGRQHARLQALPLLGRGSGGGRRGRLRVLQRRMRGLQLRAQLLRALSARAHMASLGAAAMRALATHVCTLRAQALMSL